MIIHLSFLFIAFISFTYSQTNTFNKACSTSGSNCGVGQACINGRCECDPAARRFWTGEKYGCRICPGDYTRYPNRCYKYYSTNKNHSDARADCRRNQADLFSWRDNNDENELLTASTSQWGFTHQTVRHQFYTWSGGIVHHGSGTKADYKITWMDPKGPTMSHPDFDELLRDRYCNRMIVANYNGDPEPTRQTKNGEKEDCITFVFLPRPNSRGDICMADDYCSTKMPYICELTEKTLTVATQNPTDSATRVPSPGSADKNKLENENLGNADEELTGGPSAQGENKNFGSSNKLIFVIGGALFIVIIGVVAFIVMRKQKQKTPKMAVSTNNSIASSNISGADMYEDA